MPLAAPVALGLGQQLHLALQSPEFGNQTLSLASTGKIAHAFVRVRGGETALQQELHTIDVLGSAHQERAPEAERPSSTAITVLDQPQPSRSPVTRRMARRRSRRAAFFGGGRQAVRHWHLTQCPETRH